MMARKWLLLLMVFLFMGCAGKQTMSTQDQAPRITKEEVKARLGAPDLIVIDVRQGGDWSASDMKIAGAVREDPKAFSQWADKYPKDKTLVLYCA